MPVFSRCHKRKADERSLPQVEGVNFLTGSFALYSMNRTLAMLNILVMMTSAAMMHVVWADGKLRFLSLAVTLITIIATSTMTW